MESSTHSRYNLNMEQLRKIFNYFNKLSINDAEIINPKKDDEFHKACQLLRKQREIYQLSRKELSHKTKISIAVIEAIEKGWANRLPEKAFLKRMLEIIEIELSISKGSLRPILSKANNPNEVKKSKVFTPGNIDIFRSRKGTLIYFIMIFTSILLLNKQQEKLASSHTITISPLSIHSCLDAEKEATREEESLTGKKTEIRK